MMGLVRLYLLGFKGLMVLTEILSKYNINVINQVVVGTDKNVLNDYSKEIIDICREKEIPCYTRKEDNTRTNVFSIAIGWKWLIDLERVPNLIIIHDSLLPKYRGFNPLVTALINEDDSIGATALFATPRFDEGDIIKQIKFKITYPLKITQAIELVSQAYVTLTMQILDELIAGQKLTRKPQDTFEATYSLWRDDDDYFINWNWESKKIRRFVDAIGYPYDGAKCWLNNEKVKISEVEDREDVKIENRTPGKIIFFEEYRPVVVCGIGLLRLIDIRSIDNVSIEIKSIRTRFK